MRDRRVHRRIGAVSLFLAVLVAGPPLFAQPLRVSLPGSAFSVEGRGDQVAVENVAGGRRFRGKAFSRLMLRAAIRMHPSATAEPRIERLVLHFRASPSGPSVRSVELRNGTDVAFHVETHLEGDYTARETTRPEVVANVWAFQPRAVGPRSVLRLEVQFPGGFDSAVNPGEIVITSVGLDFHRKPLQPADRLPKAGGTAPSRFPAEPGTQAKTPARPPDPRGVLYGLADDNQLRWFRHTGREDGSFRWAAPEGKTVGTGWDFAHLFSTGGGVIYGVTATGDLLWYRHDGRGDGSFRWAVPQGAKVGSGWRFREVFGGEG